MTERKVEDWWFTSLAKHPLTGVKKNHPGPEKRHTQSDFGAVALSSKYGKLIENIALQVWNLDKKTVNNELREVGQLVRNCLQDKLNRNYHRNLDIEPFYQDLTLPPEMPFWGNERLTPSWPPLEKLFSILDNQTGSRFLSDFVTLGETYPNSGIVHKNIKFLVEAALTLERIYNNPSPFIKLQLIPNLWIGKMAQLDGILTNSPSSIESVKKNPLAYLNNNDYSILEIKWDVRARHISGKANALNKRVESRHLIEIQEKLAKLIIAQDGDFKLPESIIFYYLRGTQDHIVHKISLRLPFLTYWRRGVETALDNGYIPPEQIKSAMLVLNALNLLIDQQNRKTELQISKLHEDDKLLQQSSF